MREREFSHFFGVVSPCWTDEPVRFGGIGALVCESKPDEWTKKPIKERIHIDRREAYTSTTETTNAPTGGSHLSKIRAHLAPFLRIRTAVIYVLVKSLVLTLESTLPTPFFSIWTGVKREYEFFFCGHLCFGKLSHPYTFE